MHNSRSHAVAAMVLEIIKEGKRDIFVAIGNMIFAETLIDHANLWIVGLAGTIYLGLAKVRKYYVYNIIGICLVGAVIIGILLDSLR